MQILLLPLPTSDAKYSNECAYVSFCLSVSLHISKTTCQNFTILLFTLAMAVLYPSLTIMEYVMCGLLYLVIFPTLYIYFRFVDNAVVSHNGQE